MEYDLHIHSKFSFDSTMEPKKIVAVAKKRGLYGIAVVDHNLTTPKGAIEAQKYAGTDFLVIPGVEMGTMQGDILGLFVNEVKDTKDPYEFVESVRAQGGVAILAHPFTKHLTIEKKLCEILHGAEGFNARHAAGDILPDGSFGEKQIVEFASEYKLALTGGSDAHFYWEIGRGRTVIPAMTLEEVKMAILRGNTLAVGKRSSGLFQLLSGMVHASKWFHPEFRRGGRRKKKHGQSAGDAPQSGTNPPGQGD